MNVELFRGKCNKCGELFFSDSTIPICLECWQKMDVDEQDEYFLIDYVD